MRRTIIAAGCAAVLVGSVTAEAARIPGSGSSEPAWPLAARLLGSNEISQSGKRNAGDRDARGHASVSGKGTKVCVALAYKDLDTITAAHIHRGKSKENGPVVVTLTRPENGDVGASSSCHAVDAALFRALARNPQRYYVNVHTERYPNGAIRGQLKRG